MALLEGVVLVLLFLLFQSLYNIFFHPLRRFRGPWYAGSSKLWFSYKAYKGTLPYDVKALHDTYGDIVRIAPDELSFVDPKAWQEIYGPNSRPVEGGGTKMMLFEKDPKFYTTIFANSNTVLDAGSVEHKSQKKILGAAFSRKAILTQEDIIMETVASLVEGLTSMAASNEVFDLQPWFRNTLLDISGKLICGHDLEATKYAGRYHPAITTIDRSFKLAFMYLQIRSAASFILDPIERVLQKFLLGSNVIKNINFPEKMVLQRLEKGSEKADYVSYMEPHFSADAISKSSTALFLANNETSTTLLCGVIYHLLSNPEMLSLAQREIRGKFKNIEDMDIQSTEDLNYLKACITETLRIFPPGPGLFPRVVPEVGATICGKHVPKNTVVGIMQWAMFHNEKNFVDSEQFKPERWLGERNELESSAYHPFSYGPRICLAREFALINSRLMLGYLLWKYDFELDSKSTSARWATPPAYVIFTRDPLFVRIKAKT